MGDTGFEFIITIRTCIHLLVNKLFNNLKLIAKDSISAKECFKKILSVR